MNAALLLLLWRMGPASGSVGVDGPYSVRAIEIYAAGASASQIGVPGPQAQEVTI